MHSPYEADGFRIFFGVGHISQPTMPCIKPFVNKVELTNELKLLGCFQMEPISPYR